MKLSADGKQYEVEVNFPVGKHAFKFLLVRTPHPTPIWTDPLAHNTPKLTA